MMPNQSPPYNDRFEKTTLAPNLAFLPQSMKQQGSSWVEGNRAKVLPLPTNALFVYVICHWCYQPQPISKECVLQVQDLNRFMNYYEEITEREEMAVPSKSLERAPAALGYQNQWHGRTVRARFNLNRNVL